MKEIITIEQFDNGITIEATHDDYTERLVALEHQKEQEIGKLVWATIRFLMDKHTTNEIAMEINYYQTKKE